MGMVQEQFAFLLDVSKLINEAARQGFEVTEGNSGGRRSSKRFTSKQGSQKRWRRSICSGWRLTSNFFKDGVDRG